MKKLYQKSELYFSLVWIGLYVVVMNIALQVCGGFDNLEDKTVLQMLVPVICIALLAAAASACQCCSHGCCQHNCKYLFHIIMGFQFIYGLGFPVSVLATESYRLFLFKATMTIFASWKKRL